MARGAGNTSRPLMRGRVTKRVCVCECVCQSVFARMRVSWLRGRVPSGREVSWFLLRFRSLRLSNWPSSAGRACRSLQLASWQEGTTAVLRAHTQEDGHVLEKHHAAMLHYDNHRPVKCNASQWWRGRERRGSGHFFGCLVKRKSGLFGSILKSYLSV